MFLFALMAAVPALAEDWEIGASIGYGIYRNGSIYASAGKVTAGVRNRFAAGAVFSEDLYEHISGEIRYLYHDGHPFVSGNGTRTDLQGQSHAFHYDLLFHFRPRGRRLRPYAIAGIGAKLYEIVGPGNPAQPLAAIATLTTTDELKLLVTGGAGVKYVLGHNIVARFDFIDYVTPFPKKQIQPAPYGTARGLLQQFTPLFGLGYRF